MTIDNCDAPTYYEVSLREGDAIIHTVQVDWEANVSRFLELPIDENLSPNTQYELTIVPGNGWGELTSIPFTTAADGQVAELSGAPTGEISEAILSPNEDELDGSVEVTFSLEPIADPQELSILTVSRAAAPDEVIHAVRVGEDNMDDLFGWYYLEAPFGEEACLIVRQRDGAGRFVESEAPFCKVLEVREFRKRLCSVTSAVGLVWFTPLLALATIRRRSCA